MGAQGNDFRYYLTLENKRTEIIFAPQGWDTDSIVSYKRNDYYFGMVRSYALPLQFVLDGADILRVAYYKYGVEAEVRIEVEVLNKKGNPIWGYLPYFTGDVDFSQFKDFSDYVSVTLMEGGATKNVKAYESVKYEYSLTGPDVVNMILPGVAFDETGNFSIYPSTQQNFNSMPAIKYINGLDSDVTTPHDVEERNGIDLDPNNNNWFVKINKPSIFKIKGSVSGKAYTRIVQGPATFYFEIRNQFNVLIKLIDSVTSPPTLGNTPFAFEFEHEQAFSEDTHLFLTIRGTGDNDNYCMVEAGEFTFSFSSVSPESNCKGLKAIDLFKRIVKRVSPGTTATSYLLTNKWKNLIFTSGDGIREITEPVPAKIKISLRDFFDTMNGIDNTGFGIESNNAVLETAPYFARDTQIVDLGVVRQCTLEPSQEYFFNSIKIGYNDGNTDKENGRQEYNSGQVWAMPLTRIQREQNWISPTRADQFGIEKIRVDYNVKKQDASKTTNDTSSDNDTFMVDCYFDGINYRPVLGSSYDSVDGLSAKDSAYNLELSPKKNLLRHAGYLRSLLDRMDGRYIAFGSGNKNTELVTVKNSIRVKENEDIVSSSLEGKYFIPVLASIISKIPRNAMWLIQNTPYGWVKFKYNDVVFKGYILELPIDIAKNTEQEVKLLLTNDNNLLNLL